MINPANWIGHPVVLEGEMVRLVPLERDHFPALLKIGADSRIWEYMSVDGSDEGRLLQLLESAVLKRATKEQYPFAVIEKATGAVVGSTMFHNIFPQHRKLEIGWTWYAPSLWRTGVNRECKYLLLNYCFDVLAAIRVQLVTDEINVRSRKAIEGIGGVFEGVLRNERIRENGIFRNTVMYSILPADWDVARHTMFGQRKS